MKIELFDKTLSNKTLCCCHIKSTKIEQLILDSSALNIYNVYGKTFEGENFCSCFVCRKSFAVHPYLLSYKHHHLIMVLYSSPLVIKLAVQLKMQLDARR